MAFRTLRHSQKLVGPLLSGSRVVVVDHILYVFDDSVESHEIVGGGVDEFLVNLHILQAAIQHFVHGFLGNVLDGRLEGEAMLLQDGVYLPEYHLVLVFPERCDSAFMDVGHVVGYDLFHVYLIDIPQTLAMGTSPFGRVERENVGCGVFV